MSNGCRNTCNLSPMDSFSNIGAIGIHEMNSVGVRYVDACSKDLLVILHVKRKAAEVWAHWSQSLCCWPQGEALGLLNTFFSYVQRAQQPTLLLSSMVRLTYKEGPGHAFAIHLSQIHVSRLPQNVVSSMVHLRLHAHILWVITYEWPGLTKLPLHVNCAKLMIDKMSSASSPTAPIHTWSLSAGLMRLSVSSHRFPPCVCFLSQNNNKRYFFPHARTPFHEQAMNFLTEGLLL